MCERAGAARLARAARIAGLAAPLAGLAAPARAESVVALLPLPFRVTQVRDAGSEVAVAVETSGLPQLPRRPAGGVVVMWGETGGAALTLAGDRVAVVPLSPEAIEGLSAGETPRGALAGSRRALSGPVTAYLTGATAGDPAGAAGVTVRERQPVAMSAEPKPVPVTTTTVPAGADAVFTGETVRTVDIDGALHLVVVKARAGSESLALIGREAGAWRLRAEIPAGPGGLSPAASADFGDGAPSLAVVRGAEGVLQHWSVAGARPALRAEARGYAAPAAPLALDGGGTALALPTLDRAALALVSLRGGIVERARVALPAPAGPGLAVLGGGRGAHILVVLADGRVADVRP
ncbi:hypothetical protein OPKNFCMD_2378 [Methylobacterium crusticola]|uniref:Uncharacterized protein n=1 Tax=Methylobacterium crusticola TaxID=1697972 RepID=A0ABQ4QY50_9HYPH|nr:hypothetical protein [Methylobacterium crusticola]GJD49645.1 hypothetical protein OPKNFCMD_2378 [Methylobacterium crusticola]